MAIFWGEFFSFKKLPFGFKSRPIGDKSPNLVTLFYALRL
jgi:hypothetical protein